ncbi:hypothetical protein EJB05_57870, partial [Eragrostis curvula]
LPIPSTSLPLQRLDGAVEARSRLLGITLPIQERRTVTRTGMRLCAVVLSVRSAVGGRKHRDPLMRQHHLPPNVLPACIINQGFLRAHGIMLFQIQSGIASSKTALFYNQLKLRHTRCCQLFLRIGTDVEKREHYEKRTTAFLKAPGRIRLL